MGAQKLTGSPLNLLCRTVTEKSSEKQLKAKNVEQ